MLAGLRVVSFGARRAEELATMLARHGAEVMRAPALREEPLGASPEALELARRLEAGEVDLVILLTGVGTRALAATLAETGPRLGALLPRTRIVARGPKPLAALRELGVAGAHPVPEPFTWRQVLEVVDGLGVPRGGLVAVQEYGAPVPGLVDALAERGLRVLSVPVYRWALPEDPRPLAAAAAAPPGGGRRRAEVAAGPGDRGGGAAARRSLPWRAVKGLRERHVCGARAPHCSRCVARRSIRRWRPRELARGEARSLRARLR